MVRNVVLSPESLTEVYALAEIGSDADLSRYVSTVAEVTAP